MSFVENATAMQSVIYAEMGIPAIWTTAAGAAADVTVLLAAPAASENGGGLWDERPAATPARRVRIRSSELGAAGLMILDPASRAPAPAWQGVTLNFDGVARAIMTKPEPADDTFRLEWVFDLS